MLRAQDRASRAVLALLSATALFALFVRLQPVPGHVFPSRSADLMSETKAISELLGLKPGMSVGEVGGGSGLFISAIAPSVMPGGEVFGTGLNEDEITAMQDSLTAKTGITGSFYVANTLTSGLPPACCDAIYLRMVYHMLPHPAEYLADFKRALKPGGKLLLLEHGPDNGKVTREGAKVTVHMMGRTMNMKVVPYQALVVEVADAGFVNLTDVFNWPYFEENTEIAAYKGKEKASYGILLQ